MPCWTGFVALLAHSGLFSTPGGDKRPGIAAAIAVLSGLFLIRSIRGLLLISSFYYRDQTAAYVSANACLAPQPT
jgi:hypothetical protein